MYKVMEKQDVHRKALCINAFFVIFFLLPLTFFVSYDKIQSQLRGKTKCIVLKQ